MSASRCLIRVLVFGALCLQPARAELPLPHAALYGQIKLLDHNGDGAIDISDAVEVLRLHFRQGDRRCSEGVRGGSGGLAGSHFPSASDSEISRCLPRLRA